MKKSQVTCHFFKKDGFCSKGDYCEFSHSSDPIICKYYASKITCPFGSSCAFNHSTVVNASRKPQRLSNHLLPAPQNAPPNPAPPNPPTSTTTNNRVSNSSLWGLDEDANDGVYFYGAAGSAPVTSPPSQMTFAAVARKNADENPEYNVNNLEEKYKEQNICKFFLFGTCKYGSFCRNLHTKKEKEKSTDHSNESSENLITMEEEIEAKNIDCGICMNKPEDGRLGMLSHCSCAFCITCIRQWRSSGKSIATADQIRLCPLCRKESHFIIPSTRLITNPLRKQEFMNNYIDAMATIPCRSGSCPFGTSCFYLHISTDGKLEERNSLRHFLNAEENIEIRTAMLLGDFIKPIRR
eukprot:gene6901-14009_t